MKRVAALAVLVLAGAIACDKQETDLNPVFPNGDTSRGRQAFIDLGCSSCHRVMGDDLPGPNASPGVPITLGGGHSRSRSHAELITAIVNPNHEIAPGYEERLVRSGAKSRMGDYGHVMTVQQLVDILEYLESVHGWSTYGDKQRPPESR